MAVWSSVSINRIGEAARIDSEFFRPEHMIREQLIHSHGGQQLSSIADISNGATPSEYTEDGSIAFVRSGDLTSPLIDAASSTGFLRAAPLKKMKRLQRGDVLISSIGVGSIGKISLVVDPAGLATVAEVTVARSKGTSPEYLFAYLSTPAGRGEIERRVTGATGQQHLIKREAERVLVPTSVDDKLLDELSSTVQQAIEQRRQAADLIAAAESRLMGALGLDGEGGSEGGLDLTPSKTYTRSFADLEAGGRFGAEYYMPCKKRALDALAAGPHRTLADHAPAIRKMFNPAKLTPGQYPDGVRNFDLTDALDPVLDDMKEPTDTADVGSTKKVFRPGDLVISRLRSYLKEIALVRTSTPGSPGHLPAVGSSEFIVLRPTAQGLSAPTLLAYLRSPAVQTILKWSQDGSNHPRFTEADLLKLPVPDHLFDVSDQIDTLINQSLTARRTAAALLAQAKHRVEALIEEHS